MGSCLAVILPVLDAMPYLPEVLAFGAVRRCRIAENEKLLTNKSHHITGNNNNKTTDYPDEHGYEEMGKGAFAVRMGRAKQQLCKQACKIFAFLCQSQLAGIIRAHLRDPW
jgi:hypothetical protein